MRDLLYRFYWWLEKIIVPGNRSSQYEYFDDLFKSAPQSARWLDVGCGHYMFGNWMAAEEQKMLSRIGSVVGMDLDLESIKKNQNIRHRVLCNLEAAPFADGSFDVISANMVVEHLENPAISLQSVNRLLAPSGVFVFHTSNRNSPAIRIAASTPQNLKHKLVWFFEKRAEEDVYPAWYRFNREEQIRDAAKAANLEIVSLRHVSTSALTVILGPVVALELLWMKWINAPQRAALRPNIVGVLRKPA